MKIGGDRSTTAIDVTSMAESDDRHDTSLIIDGVDDPKVSSSGAVLSRELETQSFPDAMRTLRETTMDELDACPGNLGRQSVQASQSTGRPFDRVDGGAQGDVNRVSSSSFVGRDVLPSATSWSPSRTAAI